MPGLGSYLQRYGVFPTALSASASPGTGATPGTGSLVGTLGAKPSAENTGPRSGVTLTPRTSNLTTTEDGQVISGLSMPNHQIIVKHANVVIRDCKAVYIATQSPATGLLVEYCDIGLDSGASGTPAAVHGADTNRTVRYCNIHNSDDGLKLSDNYVVEFCYIHDLLSSAASPHYDGLQVSGGSGWSIRGNTITLPTVGPYNACVFLASDFAAISNGLIEGNWLDGAGYTLHSSAGAFGSPSAITVKDNRFGRRFVYASISDRTGLTLTGNVYDDNDEALT